ncbi:hypothetical protein HK098_001775 [Nowakowskiella sp. JEL0407]|nr:hypothetical protein HK098_001775 [Nowakowskiella sp. JEL0407]
MENVVRQTSPKADSQISFVKLPHPRTEELVFFGIEPFERKFRLLEVQKLSLPPRSWFVGNTVVKDGSVYLFTPYDLLFLILPVVSAKSEQAPNKYVSVDDIFYSENSIFSNLIVEHLNIEPTLDRICDIQRTGGETYYRFNEERAVAALHRKVDFMVKNYTNYKAFECYKISESSKTKEENEDFKLRLAIKMVSDSLNQKWEKKLSDSYSSSLLNTETTPAQYSDTQLIVSKPASQNDPVEKKNAKKTPTKGFVTLPPERYQIFKKIGKGTFSSVFDALDREKKQLVAIKVLRRGVLTDSQISDVIREAAIQKSLCHPNIVQLFEFHETDTHFFLVFEKIGAEMFDRVATKGKLTEDEGRHVMKQVALGVEYLHSVGVLHRDLKLENLLYEPLANGKIGTVKICDFGLSKIVVDTTTTPVGTPNYTAPEVILNQVYGKEIDLWGLGCLMYTMLCASPPFNAPRLLGLLDAIVTGKYDQTGAWLTLSLEAKELIARLLSVNPSLRGSVEDILQDPWLTYGKNESTKKFALGSWLSKLTSSSNDRPGWVLPFGNLRTPQSTPIEEREEDWESKFGPLDLNEIVEDNEEVCGHVLCDSEEDNFKLNIENAGLIRKRKGD